MATIPDFPVPNRPPTQPSPSAAEALLGTAEEPFDVSIKKVCTNRQFLYLLVAFSSFVASFKAITEVIAQFSSPL
ncbi:hypothetical protein MVEG_09180 [Podila verticillata NRRL 6337]|nr:hypothetical protein MVEG_09180 [Podila verticillata NRRL 6337]